MKGRCRQRGRSCYQSAMTFLAFTQGMRENEKMACDACTKRTREVMRLFGHVTARVR